MLQQQTAAAEAAAPAHKVLMDAMKTFITENKPQPQPNPPKSEPTEKDKESILDRKSDIKLNEKSYKRIERFSGGDDEWEDWKNDF